LYVQQPPEQRGRFSVGRGLALVLWSADDGRRGDLTSVPEVEVNACATPLSNKQCRWFFFF
jgi:hypothetical protein